MKEYKTQMLVKGAWIFARKPFGGVFSKPFYDKEKAKEALDECIQRWEQYKKDFPKYAKDSNNPTDFRIMSREVTEWVCEERTSEELRNWIEKAIGKQWCWPPVCIGTKHGRERYEIDWTDGTTGHYFIDFENETIVED